MYPNTVQKISIDNTELFIVGEHARSSASGELCVEVIETKEPDLICVESCPERFDFYCGSGYQSTVGIFAAEQYCREEGTELFLADILQSDASLELQLLPDNDELNKERPTFDKSNIKSDGSVTGKDIIQEHIEKNKEYSQERFDFIWNVRENFIANAVLQKIKSSDKYEKVVIIVGLTHLYRVVNLLQEKSMEDIGYDSEFIEKRSFELHFKDLLKERDSETFYEDT